MATMTHRQATGVRRAPAPTGLAEVVDLNLDEGLVIDAFVRVSVVGIELLTIDARIVVASVDTYLRFAEAVNRLDLPQGRGLPELFGDAAESGAEHKTRGAIEGVRDKLPGFGGREEKEAAAGASNER